jgi:hypothetical protein
VFIFLHENYFDILSCNKVPLLCTALQFNLSRAFNIVIVNILLSVTSMNKASFIVRVNTIIVIFQSIPFLSYSKNTLLLSYSKNTLLLSYSKNTLLLSYSKNTLLLSYSKNTLLIICNVFSDCKTNLYLIYMYFPIDHIYFIS